MDIDEIDRLLEKALGPPPTSSPRVTPRMLDDFLASRTHVRVLRVLVTWDSRTNLTARDLARRAEASHSRVLEVLRHLTARGLVRAHPAATHTIYRLAEEHPLTGAIRSVFDEERRTGEQT